jgi:carbon-monoxide dehydrogenase large subunit
MNAAPPKYGMGARVRRMEDKSLLVGTGRFTDDYTPEGTLRAVVLRSTAAHAGIVAGNLEAARAMPGVRLILTHADLAGYGGVPCKIKLTQVDGTPMKAPLRPLLVGDVVRHVGDPIAFVVADDVESARMAAEAISVDYKPLDAVVDMKVAVTAEAPLIWPEHGDNVAYRVDKGDKAATDAAFAKAARVSKIEIVNNRVVANYMETRGIVAEYDAGSGRYTLTLGTQGGHGMRDIIAKNILHVDPFKYKKPLSVPILELFPPANIMPVIFSILGKNQFKACYN